MPWLIGPFCWYVGVLVGPSIGTLVSQSIDLSFPGSVGFPVGLLLVGQSLVGLSVGWSVRRSVVFGWSVGLFLG